MKSEFNWKSPKKGGPTLIKKASATCGFGVVQRILGNHGRTFPFNYKLRHSKKLFEFFKIVFVKF